MINDKNKSEQEFIDILPETNIYTIFQRINYKPQGAVAEFVDNSTASYFKNKEKILEFEKKNGNDNFKLQINILFYNSKNTDDKSHLKIIDNAAGMNRENFGRALRLNEKPENQDGRNEFGMGLKTAAIWFGDILRVETTSIDDGIFLSSTLDIKDLENNRTRYIKVNEKQKDALDHGTTILIRNLRNPFKTKNQKYDLKNKLTNIYFKDIQENNIEIRFVEYLMKEKIWVDINGHFISDDVINGYLLAEPLKYEEPKLLIIPAGNELNLTDQDQIMKNEFSTIVEFEDNSYFIKGWIGILEKGNRDITGFTLLRRGRVILGESSETKFKPTEIFGSKSGFRQLRLIGEIEMDTFPVTQSKDDFAWNNGLKDEFINSIEPLTKNIADIAEKWRQGEPADSSSLNSEFTESNIKKMMPNNSDAIKVKKLSIENDEENIEHKFQIIFDDENLNLSKEVNDKKNKYEANEGNISIEMQIINDRNPKNWIQISLIKENKYYAKIYIEHKFLKPYASKADFIKFIMKFGFAYTLAFIDSMNNNDIFFFNEKFNSYLLNVTKDDENEK